MRRLPGLTFTCLLWLLPALAAAQEAKVSFRAASTGTGSALPLFSLDAPAPTSNNGAMLPALSLTSGDEGPRVQNLVMALPEISLGDVAVRSRLGDQPLPAMFRSSSLAGASLTAPVRGLSLTTAGKTPVSLVFGQAGMNSTTGLSKPGTPSLMALGFTLAPSTRVSVAPQVIVPVGSPDAQAGISTAIRTQLPSGLAVVTDVGAAKSADVHWSPLASARLVGQWSHAGIETSVVRGAPAPQTTTGTDTSVLRSRDVEAAKAQIQPLPNLTLSALTSLSRPSTDSSAPDTTAGSFNLTYAGLPSGQQLAAVHERQETVGWESESTSLEWRQAGLTGVNVRLRQKRETDPMVPGVLMDMSRVEIDLPAIASRQKGSRLDLRAALGAGPATSTTPEFSSRLSGRIDLADDVSLTGETELGLGDGQVLRGLRVITDVPVLEKTGLQLLYTYRIGPQLTYGQAFEARISKKINLGFW